ncbi:hypothetical protein CALVIDRAFT_595328 [Calocera viscosa TUFC12733]|uniref:Uncharacterized protein n=1 Tax=Calocera viscosa (strain TUFC12733) TaxID=1330018 RepID=A0A167R3V9_CALVF|nr:hypothetical protein CALVIDRAFT_595328 [Calocera viscosa TUFC12733]
MAAEPQKRQGASGTDQPLPDWMSYSAYTTASNGERGYTIVQLPQTYYGPSIPLGTDGVYTYGGLSSPAADAEAAPTDSASPSTSDANPFAVSSTPEEPLSSPTITTPTPETTDPGFLSTLSDASVRSTSLAEELTSAFSVLSQAEEASQSVESVFSQESSSASVFSTESTASTQSTASVQSVSSVSRTSAFVGRITSRRESRSSTRSVESTASVRSRESTSSTASAASLTSLASIASVASVSSISRVSQSSISRESVASTASAASASSISSSATSSPSAVAAASSGFPTSNIIALAIGLFFAVLLLLLLIVCFFRWRQRRNRGTAAQRRIPTDRSHSIHQSMFFAGGAGPSDGRVNVQGTVFDLWTPEQRAARDMAQQRRSVSSWAGRTLALITGTRGSRGSGSGGSGGSRGSRRTGSSRIGVARKVSRTAAEDGMLEEETPLVGHQSPPLSPPPFHSPPVGGTPLSHLREASPMLPDVPLFARARDSAARDSASSLTSSPLQSRNPSRATLPLSTLSRAESAGDGEHETAELLVAQRATRSPSPKMGRLSWLQRMGIIGGGGPSTSSQEGHAASTAEGDPGSESDSELAPPEMTEIRTEGGSSLKSWLEMGGMSSSFPQPPPIAQAREPGSLNGQPDGVRLSTISTNTVYHDALSDVPPSSSRPGTPPVATIPAPPAPSTPPRRRPVPPFLSHPRGIGSGSLLGSRTDLLDLPVPSPLRRAFNPGTGSPPSAWMRQQPYSPDLDDELPPPPASAWRNSRNSDEAMSPLELGNGFFGRDREEEERRPGSLKRFTFGYPMLVDEPKSPPRSRDKQLGSPRPLPPGAAPPSIRDSLVQFDTASSRGGAFSIRNPSLGPDTSYNTSTSMTSTPRSSVAGFGLPGLGLDDPAPMPASAFGKPKLRGGLPTNATGSDVDSSGR